MTRIPFKSQIPTLNHHYYHQQDDCKPRSSTSTWKSKRAALFDQSDPLCILAKCMVLLMFLRMAGLALVNNSKSPPSYKFLSTFQHLSHVGPFQYGGQVGASTISTPETQSTKHDPLSLSNKQMFNLCYLPTRTPRRFRHGIHFNHLAYHFEQALVLNLDSPTSPGPVETISFFRRARKLGNLYLSSQLLTLFDNPLRHQRHYGKRFSSDTEGDGPLTKFRMYEHGDQADSDFGKSNRTNYSYQSFGLYLTVSGTVTTLPSLLNIHSSTPTALYTKSGSSLNSLSTFSSNPTVPVQRTQAAPPPDTTSTTGLSAQPGGHGCHEICFLFVLVHFLMLFYGNCNNDTTSSTASVTANATSTSTTSTSFATTTSTTTTTTTTTTSSNNITATPSTASTPALFTSDTTSTTAITMTSYVTTTNPSPPTAATSTPTTSTTTTSTTFTTTTTPTTYATTTSTTTVPTPGLRAYVDLETIMSEYYEFPILPGTNIIHSSAPSPQGYSHWQLLLRLLLQSQIERQGIPSNVPRIRSFGKAFSSDSEGDGPKTKTHRLTLRRKAPTNKRSRSDLREEVDEDFTPVIGQRIYVDLETFSSEYYSFPTLTGLRQEYSMAGIYSAMYWQANSLVRATVQFFSPEIHSWTLGLNWIKQFGWRTERQQGRRVVNRFLLNSPNEPEQLPTYILNPTISEATEHSTYSHLDARIQQDMMQFPSHRSGNFGIGMININGYADRKLPYIGWIMKRANIGCFSVIDSRIKPASYKFIRRNWEEFHPGGQIQFFTGPSNVGGVAVFLDSEWSPRLWTSWSDASGLGIINELTFHSNEGIVRLLVIYWPFQSGNMNDNNNSLVTHLRRWILASNRNVSPDRYIYQNIEARRRKGGLIMVMGDLNTQEHSSRYQWMQDLGLTDVHGQPPEPFSTRFAGTQPTGRIDYIFTTATAQDIGWSESTEFEQLSDHRPIWAHFLIAGPRPTRTCTHQRTISKKPNFQDTAFMDKAVKDITSAFLHILSCPLPDKLKAITDSIVEAYQTTQTIKERQYWSPTSMARTYWLTMSSALSKQPSHQWSSTVRYYSKLAASIGADGLNEWKSLEAEFPAFLHFSSYKFASMMAEVKKTLHAKYKEHERWQIMEATQRRENDPKIIFRSLGKPRHQVNLSRIITRTSIITDPAAIHEEMTNIFELWLANPAQGPEHRDLWTTLEEQSHEEQIRHLQTIFADKMVPAEFIVIFHQALFSTNGKRELVERDLAPLLSGPTLAQFREELQGASNTSAGGPSGLTYGMLKHTPDAVIEYIYELLCEAWQRGISLPWLRRKILCPIPKPGMEDSATAYRPIMLLEVIRKTWVGALVRIIRRTWDKHSILCDSQYGFRAGRSTLAPLIQVINALEGATEEGMPLYVSSWDIRRAFDSPPRWIIDLSLRRLGIPHELATYLAYLDDDDHITVATPWGKSQSEARSFSSRHGAGQGDKGSPTFWNGIFDILLTALALEPSGFSTMGDNGEMTELFDTAYADDCISGAGSLVGLQRKADLFSATALLLNLDVAIDKFRTFSINHPDSVPLTPIDIHTRGWHMDLAQFNNSGFIKYLGSKLSFDLSSKEEQSTLRSFLEETATRLRPKGGSAETHLTFIKGSPLMKVIYAGGFSSLTLKEARNLDKPLGGHIKSISHLASSFPNVLLYAPVSLGGIGAPRTSDAIFETHLKTIIKAQRADPRTRNSMAAILARQGRKFKGTRRYGYEKLSPAGERGYLTGLLEYLEQGNLFLGRCFPYPVSFCEQPWNTVSKWKPKHLIVNLVSDLLRWDGSKFCFLDDITDGGQPTPRELLPTIPDDIPTVIQLRPGQFWGNPTLTTIVQLRGWNEDGLWVWTWETTRSSTRFRRGQKLQITRSSPTFLNRQDAGQYSHKCLVELCDGQHYIRACSEMPTSYPTPHIPTPLSVMDSSAGDIMCVDGSYCHTHQGPFRQQRVKQAGAAVAIINADGQVVDAFSSFNFDPDLETNAYAEETRALTLALGLQFEHNISLPIYTDCKSALTAHRKTCLSINCRQWEYATENGPLISMGKEISTHLPATTDIQWTRSHPELRKPLKDFSIVEHGNYIVDKLAGGQDADKYAIDISHSLHLLTRLDQRWVLYNADGPCPLSHRTKIYRQLLMDYYRDRSIRYDTPYDLIRVQHAMLCNQTVKGKKHLTIGQRGARLKLILSRFDRDRINRQGQDPNTPSICTCGCPGTLYSWMTCCKDPPTVELRTTARRNILQLTSKVRGFSKLISDFMLSDPEFWRGNSLDYWDSTTTFFTNRSNSPATWKASEVLLDNITDAVLTTGLEMQSLHRQGADKIAAYMVRAVKASADRAATYRRSIKVRSISSYFTPLKQPPIPSSPPPPSFEEPAVHLNPAQLNIPNIRRHHSLYRSPSPSTSPSEDSDSTDSSVHSNFHIPTLPSTSTISTRGRLQRGKGGFEVLPEELELFDTRGDVRGPLFINNDSPIPNAQSIPQTNPTGGNVCGNSASRKRHRSRPNESKHEGHLRRNREQRHRYARFKQRTASPCYNPNQTILTSSVLSKQSPSGFPPSRCSGTSLLEVLSNVLDDHRCEDTQPRAPASAHRSASPTKKSCRSGLARNVNAVSGVNIINNPTLSCYGSNSSNSSSSSSSNSSKRVLGNSGRKALPGGEVGGRSVDILVDDHGSRSNGNGASVAGEVVTMERDTEDGMLDYSGGQQDGTITGHECGSSSSSYVCQVCGPGGGMRKEMQWLQTKMSYS